MKELINKLSIKLNKNIVYEYNPKRKIIVIAMLKRWKLFFFYVRTIKRHREELKEYIMNLPNRTYVVNDIRYDRLYKLYTVVNFPQIERDIVIYGNSYLNNELKKFLKDLNNKLVEYNLIDLVKVSRAQRVGLSSILIVIEFKLININKVLFWLIMFILAGIISSLFIL